jgi:GTPase SAR1 family protein
MSENPDEGVHPSSAHGSSMAAEIGGKLAEETLKGLVPWVKKKYRTWRHGKTVLILGPARVGKTNLFYYLLYKILNPVEETEITTDITSHRTEPKTLKIGEGLSVIIKKPLDASGHVSAFRQVQDVEKYKPHCIVIVVDATAFYKGGSERENSLAWLREFCQHIDVSLSTNRKIARQLKSMFVVVNKWDRIAAQDKYDGEDNKETWELYELEVREILEGRLNNPFYKKGGNKIIRVLPCTLVELTPPDDSLAKRVRQSIVQSLI